jgi:hypothetical protein
MESVAHFLQTEAHRHAPGSRDFDLFGRSSFNRYYYAAYLQVRAILGDLDRTWATLSHASIPELLTGQILSRIKHQSKRAAQIRDGEAVGICNRAASSAHDLADLMKAAYAVRIAADYHPDIAVEPDGEGRFRLYQVNVTAAHEWPARALAHGEKIRRAWNLSR